MSPAQALPLFEPLGLEASVAVPRDVDGDLPVVGSHRLGRVPAAAIALALGAPLARLVAEVLGQLGLERGLEQLGCELLEDAPSPRRSSAPFTDFMSSSSVGAQRSRGLGLGFRAG